MVYTVIVHDKGPAKPRRFVFAQLPEAVSSETLESGKKLNASHRKELEASFGKDYEKVLQLKDSPTFIQDRAILADDTIEQLFYKILESCAKHEESVYMWCKRRVSDKDIFVRYMLKSIFNARIFVAKSEVLQFFEFLTGKSIEGEQEGDEPIDLDGAYEMLAKQDVRYIFEPLGFKYFQNDAPVFFPVNPVKTTPKGYEYESRFWDAIADGSKTLEAHDPYKNTIYCATRGFFESKKINADFYLRLVENQDTRKFYKDQFKTMRDIMEKRDDESQVTETDAASSSITQLQLRVAQNTGETVNEEMNFIFAHFQPDDACPFVKYTSMDGVVFKMYKPALNDTSTFLASHIKKWTKVENNMYTARKNETISFKIFLGKHNIIPYFGTIVLYPSGIYDVRLSFSIQDTVNNAFIKRALNIMNASVISKIQGLAPIDTRVLDGIQRDSSTSITRMSVNSALKIEKKTVTLEGIAGNALKYNPCFSVLSVNKSHVQLAYRRISEYASSENIMIFINKNMTFKTVKEQIVKRVSMVFGIPLQQALDYVNEYNTLGSGDQDAFMNRNLKKGYRGALFRILNVKVSLGNGGSVRVFMDGVTNVAYKSRVEEYLRMILSESSSNKKNAAKVGDIVDDEDVLQLLKDLDLDSEMGGDDSDEDMLDEEFKKLLENAVNDGENVDVVDEDKNDVVEDVKKADNGKKEDVKYDFPIFKYVHEHDDDPIVSKVVNAVNADAKNKRSGETLTDLEKNDPQLFQTVPGEKNYSTLCQMTHKSFPRQPVSVRPEEFFEMKKQHPKATRNWIAYGSDEEHARRNIYFCPDVWCPTSRVAMSGKDYEAKGCPLGKEETPIMYYNAELTKGKKVYVGLMKNKGKTSFRHACFPCCYLRAPKDKAECAITEAAPVKEEMTLNERHAFSDKQRYIMKDKMVPLPESRYGLLTPALSKFFGNDKDALGTGADGAGHMSKKTNAFLRVGINYKRQSFLECIAHLLNNDKIKTAEDIVSVIAKNIRVEHFVALQGGLLIKRFWSWNKSDAEGSVDDQGEYNKFRTWFLAQESYVEKCGLKYLHDIIWVHTSFAQKMPYAEHVRREFVIYQTFHRFLEYIADDRVVKTHDVLLHLFTQKMQWLNPTGMNILVFESHPNGNATLSCYSHQPKQIIHTGRPVVMMVKTGAVYEPIYHIKINGVSIDGKYRHDMHQNATVGRIIQYFINSCNKSKSHSLDNMKIIMACKKLGLDVKYQVSDYDMRAIGIVVKDDLFVPYLTDSPIENNWNVQFIDSMYVNVRPKLTIDEAKKIFKKVGAETGDTDIYKSLDSSGHITVGSRKLLVPFKESSGSSSTKMTGANIWDDDLNVFIRSASKDPRMDAIDMSNAIENLKVAVRNELIHWLNHDSKKRGKSVLEELEFLRHPSNPIPKEIMRKILYDQLKEPMTDIVYKSTAPLYTGQFSDGLCQVLENPINCANQCKMIVTMVNKSIAKRQCKIHVTESLYNIVVAQVLDDLLNPYVKMKIKRINKQVHVDSDVIVFNYQDVEVGRLDRIIEDARDLDVAQLAIQKKREPLDFEVFSATIPAFSQEATLPHINSDETTNIHSTYVKDLKGFEALVVKDYTAMSLYELFTAIYNRIHMGANVTPADFREMVMHQVVAMWDRDEKETKDELNRNKAFPSGVNTRDKLMAWYQGEKSYPGRLELKKMAEIAEVDVFLISRPREGEPDNLRCLTRGDNERSPYIVLLQQMKMIDKKYQRYDIVVNNDKKYLFEMNDFSKNFQTIMTNKCTVYRIKVGGVACASASSPFGAFARYAWHMPTTKNKKTPIMTKV